MKRRDFLQKSMVVLGAFGAARELFADKWTPGLGLPNLATFGLEGTLPRVEGKVVYLDFWASWCAPCKASFPVLNRWQQEFGSKGFTVLGVSVDESASKMASFLEKFSVKFPVVRDAEHRLVEAANVSAMPTAFLIDRKGVIRGVHNGFREGDEAGLGAQISALLGER